MRCAVFTATVPVTAPAMSDIEFEDLIDSLSEASNYIDVKENDEGK
jgi:hypothetical protein